MKVEFTVFLLVVCLGAIGVGVRYIATLNDDPIRRAIIIAAINAVGSFAIGYVIISLRDTTHTALLPALAVGLLGGLTTFSSFSFDVVSALDESRFGFAAGLFAGTITLSFDSFYFVSLLHCILFI